MYMNETLFADFLKTREILWVGINFAKAKFTRKKGTDKYEKAGSTAEVDDALAKMKAELGL